MSQTQEQAPLPPVMTSENVSRFNDGGYMEAKMVAVAASVAVMGALGLIDRLQLGVEKDLSLEYGKGTLNATYVMPTNYCHGGYINQVKGAKAKFEAKPSIGGHGFSVTEWFSEEFDGHLTSQVCNTGTDGSLHIDFDAHKEQITIPESSLNTVIYRTNPLERHPFNSDKGFLAAQLSGNVDLLNTIPGVHIKTIDDLEAFLRGLAELAADETSSKACGEKAWDHLKVAYVDQIKQDEATSLNLRDPSSYQWKPEDISVTVPENVQFATQYHDLLNTALENIKGKGVKISQPNEEARQKITCEDASGPTMLPSTTGENS